MPKRKPPVDLPRHIQDGRAYALLMESRIPASVVAVMAGKSETEVERLVQAAKEF